MPAFGELGTTISSNIHVSSSSTYGRLNVTSNSPSSYHGFNIPTSTNTPSSFKPTTANALQAQQTPTPGAHGISPKSLITGIVVGTIFGCILVLCCFAIWRRRRKRQQRIPPSYNAAPFWFTIESNLGEMAELPAAERGFPGIPAELVGTEAAAELDGRNLGRKYVQRPKRYRTLPRLVQST
jgi:hypothetical protein